MECGIHLQLAHIDLLILVGTGRQYLIHACILLAMSESVRIKLSSYTVAKISTRSTYFIYGEVRTMPAKEQVALVWTVTCFLSGDALSMPPLFVWLAMNT